MPCYLHFTEELPNYPFVAIGVCANDSDSWYVAGPTRAIAIATFKRAAPQFPKPAYLIVAKFNQDRLRADIALSKMTSPSELVN